MKSLFGITTCALLLSTGGAYAQDETRMTIEQTTETQPIQKEVQVEKEIQEVPVPVPVPAPETKSNNSSSSSYSSRTIEKQTQPTSTIKHRTMGYRAPAKRKLSMSTSKKCRNSAPSQKLIEHDESYNSQQSSSSSE